MTSYRFERLGADGDWLPAGEQEIRGETSSREAFERLTGSRQMPPGRYRYKRSDEKASHPWGYFTLTDGGSVFTSS